MEKVAGWVARWEWGRVTTPFLGQIFLDRLESGAELPAGHPILKLRDRLIDLRGPATDQNTQIDEILAAWSRFRKKPGIALPAQDT